MAPVAGKAQTSGLITPSIGRRGRSTVGNRDISAIVGESISRQGRPIPHEGDPISEGPRARSLDGPGAEPPAARSAHGSHARDSSGGSEDAVRGRDRAVSLIVLAPALMGEERRQRDARSQGIGYAGLRLRRR
ncbi:hypothetical protein B6G06_03095 [Actinomyces gaoshouyii]|nr:hypothetical protein B6G06_03095 [Actinomyces gaoshouyii]